MFVSISTFDIIAPIIPGVRGQSPRGADGPRIGIGAVRTVSDPVLYVQHRRSVAGEGAAAGRAPSLDATAVVAQARSVIVHRWKAPGGGPLSGGRARRLPRDREAPKAPLAALCTLWIIFAQWLNFAE